MSLRPWHDEARSALRKAVLQDRRAKARQLVAVEVEVVKLTARAALLRPPGTDREAWVGLGAMDLSELAPLVVGQTRLVPVRRWLAERSGWLALEGA